MKSTATLQKSIVKTTTDMRGHIKAIQTEHAALIEEHEWLEFGPLPKSEVIERVNSFVDDQANRYDVQGKLAAATLAGAGQNLRDNLAGLFKVSGSITNGRATGGAVTGFIDSTVGPPLCHFFPDSIKATLAKDIDTLDYQAGPPAAERSALIADLDKRIHALEVEEETLIESAEESGIEILRRVDCDPAIVLGFEIIEEERPDPPKYEPVPETRTP